MSRSLRSLTAIAAFGILVPTGFAAAQGVFVGPPPSIVDPQPLTGLRKHVAHELRLYGYGDVDVTILSNRTIVLLENVIHGNGSQSQVYSRIGSVLGGGGLLQRTIDRASGRY